MLKNIFTFLLGVLAGYILTISLFSYNINKEKIDQVGFEINLEQDIKCDINFFETPISYENKASSSFKVFKVLKNAAMAREVSNKQYSSYHGKTVLLLDGQQYYDEQIVNIKKPMQLGTYRCDEYTGECISDSDNPLASTVPVIDNANK